MGQNVTIRSYRKEREKEIRDGLEDGMNRVGAIVADQAKANVSKTGVEHPQVKTGQLYGSIIWKVDKEGNQITTTIGSWITKPPYPRWLELGTPNGQMPPYPWLFPAVEAKRNQIVELLKGHEFTIT